MIINPDRIKELLHLAKNQYVQVDTQEWWGRGDTGVHEENTAREADFGDA